MHNKEEINKVLSVLSEWKKDESYYDGGGIWKRYNALSDETGLFKTKLQSILKTLRDKGIIDYAPTINSDGQINGMGYFIKDIYLDKKIEEIEL